mmetsp:Transcript_18832/g.27901  ORF Transcript_18832/g.27901 Transcript_18832/m.27901 type:complete len:105 (+) Transcript_18832:793-1107(+)
MVLQGTTIGVLMGNHGGRGLKKTGCTISANVNSGLPRQAATGKRRCGILLLVAIGTGLSLIRIARSSAYVLRGKWNKIHMVKAQSQQQWRNSIILNAVLGWWTT